MFIRGRPRKKWIGQQAIKDSMTLIRRIRGIYHDEPTYSYHISSLMDWEMKDEKLKRIQREWNDKYVAYDNNPERTERLSLSSKLAKGGDSVSNIEMRHVPVPEDDNIFLYTGQ